MIQRIKANCRRGYFPAIHESGTRVAAQIHNVVWHDTEGGTATSNARYFQSPSSGGSVHIVVDDMECQRCLGDLTVPWGAPGFNFCGLHIEQAASASWGKARWLMHSVMLHRTAYKTARWCKQYHVPVRFLTGAEIATAYPHVPAGITTHWEITKSGKYGDTHTDPGAGFPRRYTMGLVRFYRSLMLP